MRQTNRKPDLRSLRSRALGARLVCALFMLVAAVQAYEAGKILIDELTFSYSIFLISLTRLATPMLVVFTVSLLVIAPWIHRAHANLHDAGLPGLTVSPRWAVASFLVPGPNFIVPHGAMRELWNRSHGEEPQDARADVGDVNAWWTCLLVGMGIMVFLLTIVAIQRFTPFHILTPVGVNTGMFLFSILLLAGSAWFLQSIVAAVTKAQCAFLEDLAETDIRQRKLVVIAEAEAEFSPQPA